ncbi:MAG: type II toxin-antitoxin system RelE/ParE family toxin [Gemmatimonadota bacterium]
MRVVWSPLALAQASEAARHLAEDSPQAARQWVDGLFACAAALSRFPRRGRRVPELERSDLRELLFGSYRVVYRIEPRRVAVLTVRHLRRLFDEPRNST